MNFIRNVTNRDIEEASRALIDGNLVAFPTETVYGLGADATNQAAVNRMYEVKGRPKNHPVIVHVSSFEKIKEWAVEIPATALELGKKYWPGPLTLVLKRSKIARDFITGGQDSVAIRVPNHPVALSLIRKFEEFGGSGLIAPSANLFGKVSPTRAEDVMEDLENHLHSDDFVLNGGECEFGIESTIVNCISPKLEILRSGLITKKQLSSFLDSIGISDFVSTSSSNNKIKFPGNLKQHYAPRTKVVVNQEPNEGDGLISLIYNTTRPGVIRLESPTSLNEFAKVLYRGFRKGDRMAVKRIVVQISPNDDLSYAIINRAYLASGGG